MRVKVQKWGNSLAVRIPKPFAEEADLEEGADLNLSVRDGKLVAAPVVQGKYTLGQMLRRITKENIHEETEWGRPMGRESW